MSLLQFSCHHLLIDVNLTSAKIIFSLPSLFSPRTTLSQRLEDLHNQIKSWQASVSPLTDSVVSTIADSTADLRTSIINDIENLRTELLPKRAHLRDVIKAHLGDYYAQLQPLLNEYHQKHQAEMADLKTKLEPIIEALTAKLVTNVEETKAALVPIVEAVRLRVNARLESLKSSIKPYVDEYKDQLEQAYHHAQSMNADEITALKTKIEPLAEDVVAKVQAIFQNIVATFIKN